ncbi:MAG: tail protein X [Salinisphaeraceae bacterium]
MRRQTRAIQGDTVDAICHRVFGTTAGVTEATLELNPGLAALGPRLPEGTVVTLPEPPEPRARAEIAQLWS